MTHYTTTVDSPCGPLLCVVNGDGAVVRIEFNATGTAGERREPRDVLATMKGAGIDVVEDPERTDEVRRQLAEYFAGARRDFDLDLAPEGTAFERSVWEALRQIPFGETRSYGEIAEAIGHPGAARAVGRANGANPIPIVVPCHRVIGSNGSLTGFGGGLENKSRLLELEGGALPFG